MVGLTERTRYNLNQPVHVASHYHMCAQVSEVGAEIERWLTLRWLHPLSPIKALLAAGPKTWELGEMKCGLETDIGLAALV